jgi:uncharacterized membrane protein HdeD (DUF308 family)
MSTPSVSEEVKRRSTWSTLMGIVTAVLGCFLIIYPIATAMNEPFEQ